MRKIFFAVIAVLVAGCAGNKPLPLEEVGGELSKTLCAKYEECQKKAAENQTQPNSIPPFDKEKCLKEISTGVTERLKMKADAKITKKNIEACSATISSSACEILTAETAPKGCEFLQ